MACERLVMAAALTTTVKYPQYARTLAMMAMKSKMMWHVITDVKTSSLSNRR